MTDENVNKHIDYLNKILDNPKLSEEQKKSHRYSLEVIQYLKNKPTGRKKMIDDEQIRKLQAEGLTQEEVTEKLNISLSSVRRSWKKLPKDRIFTLEVEGVVRKYFRRKLDVQKERDSLESENNSAYKIAKDSIGYFLKEMTEDM